MSHKSVEKKRQNTEEASGFSPAFFSFSLTKKQTGEKASLRENKALILHTVEDSNQ